MAMPGAILAATPDVGVNGWGFAVPGDKMQREIEEILAKEERKIPIRVRRPSGNTKRGGPMSIRITPERLVLAGLALMLAAVIIRRFMLPLVIVGIALLATGYVWTIRRRRGAASQTFTPHWRGEPVHRRGNMVNFPDTWQNRLRRWFGLGRRR